MAKTTIDEYIRKDAFIEKVCEYMRSHIDQQLTIYHEQTWKKRDEFIEDFKRYMGELRNALQEEPVSEDLEEAAIEYFGGHKGADARVRAGFLTGAMWQKQQMINGAVETIIDSKPNDYGEFIPIIHFKVGSSYKDGEKVRIIIIKEEICG